MTREPFIAHSELTNEIYIVVGKEKYRVTEQAIKAVMAIKALEQEPTTKNDLGVDWENYKDVDGNSLYDLILEVLQNNFDCGNTYGYKVADEIIGLLPSVTPIRPKGHWDIKDNMWWICSACGCQTRMMKKYNVPRFCPACGAKMVEPQESEDKE